MKTFWFCSSSILNSFPASSRGHRGKPLISFAQHNASDCNFCIKQFSSVSHSGVSNCLRPRGLQHTRRPCPSPTPRAYSNSCSLSWWCHPTISSSVIPFSSCLQSFPALGSFRMSQFFASGGQSTEASASAPILPMNIQDWFPLELTGLIFLQSKGLSRVLQYHSSQASVL